MYLSIYIDQLLCIFCHYFMPSKVSIYIYLFIYLYVSIYLYWSIPVYLLSLLHAFQGIIYLYIYLSIHLPLCIYLSIHLFIYLYVSIYLHILINPCVSSLITPCLPRYGIYVLTFVRYVVSVSFFYLYFYLQYFPPFLFINYFVIQIIVLHPYFWRFWNRFNIKVIILLVLK